MLSLYRRLLRLYPAAHRRTFGDEMMFVFVQAEGDIVQRSRATRIDFYSRELGGLLSGALQAHFVFLLGSDGWLPLWRLNMRPGFRFPRSTVFLMSLILLGVVLAIEKAKIIVQMKTGLPPGGPSVWDPMLWSLLFAIAMVLVAVGAVWGVLFALHRTGVQRLAELETLPPPQAR